MADPEPVGVLTAVSVAGGATIDSITSAMSCKLNTGDITKVSVTLTADAGSTIKVDNKAVTSATAFVHDFQKKPTITIKVTNGSDNNTYTLTVYDELQEVKLATVKNMGWFGARAITGDLDAYTAGGISIPMGNFKPKYVINIQVTNGYTGFFDVNTKKLIIYSAAGTEATAANIRAEKYSLLLME